VAVLLARSDAVCSDLLGTAESFFALIVSVLPLFEALISDHSITNPNMRKL
jgi:hypothetical protein